MSWDNLISVINRIEAKANIEDYQHLDKHSPKERWPLKLSINSRDERPSEKPQPKATTLGLTVTPAKLSGPRRVETEAGKKAQKERKRKSHRERREKVNSPSSGANRISTAGKKKTGHNRGQNRGQNQDLYQVTYVNCDKKSHYATNYTEPPK